MAASPQYVYVADERGIDILPVNIGQASFVISGESIIGNTLKASLLGPDPGGNGLYAYQWQASSDGNSWQTRGNEASFTITSAEYALSLRLLITYTDGQGIVETLSLDAGIVKAGLPQVSIDLEQSEIRENSGAAFVYTVSRTGPTNSSLSVHYTVSGSATAGVDYTGIEPGSATGVITFEPGKETASLVITPTVDGKLETDETIEISLVELPEYKTISSSPVIATIVDSTPGLTTGDVLLAAPLSLQTLTTGKAFSLKIRAFTFLANDQSLTYSASLGDGSPLPSWLAFDPSSQTLRTSRSQPPTVKGAR
jgi:hypothetical protein